MSKPFSDLNLTDEEISKNYTWQQIKKTQDIVDSNIFVDTDRDIIVTANIDNNIDTTVGLDRVTVYGTAIDLTNSKNVVCLGHNTVLENVDGGVIIGGDRNGTPDHIKDSTNTIIIGHNLDCGLTSAVTKATVIGHDSILKGVGNTVVVGNDNTQNIGGNIIIGHDVVDAELANNNNIIITNGQLNAEPASGSIVFGGAANSDVAADGIIQFLSDGLEDVGAGFNVPTIPDGGGGFDLPFDGYIPLKYKGLVVYIPFFIPPTPAPPAP
jgi:hypothetical protein